MKKNPYKSKKKIKYHSREGSKYQVNGKVKTLKL